MAGGALWPVIGVAGIGLARAATAAVGEGLSFAAALTRGLSPSAEESDAAKQTAADDVREALKRRIEAFADRIKQQLAAAGIDVSQALTLTSDGLGGITAGDHPQRAAIEELLEGDVLLLRDFDRLKDDYEAAESDGAFQVAIAESKKA
jgi:hypothetical protein